MEVRSERDTVARYVILSVLGRNEMRSLQRLQRLFSGDDAAKAVRSQDDLSELRIPTRSPVSIKRPVLALSDTACFPADFLGPYGAQPQPSTVTRAISLFEDDSVRAPMDVVSLSQFGILCLVVVDDEIYLPTARAFNSDVYGVVDPGSAFVSGPVSPDR